MLVVIIWRTDGKFDHRKTLTPICQHNFHRNRNKYRPLKSLICLLNPDLKHKNFNRKHPRADTGRASVQDLAQTKDKPHGLDK